MLVNKPTLHPMARAALVEIQSAGVEVTPEIVLWVQDAATRIRKTPLRSVAELVDWPVACGGVLLYPLSFGAADWLSNLPERVRLDVRTIAFACAHVKQPQTFDTLRHILPAATAVMRWAMRLQCSREALAAAVDEAIGLECVADVPSTVQRKRDAESVEWGTVVRALCTKYPGTTPDYWTWSVSREKCYAMIAQLNAELPDDAKVTDYEVEANVAFRSIIEHIKASEAAHG